MMPAIFRCCLVTASIVTATCSGAHAATLDTPFLFEGTWRVTRVNGYSEESVSPAEIHRLIGQHVTIGEHQLRIGSYDCVPDTMRVSTLSTTALLLNEYRAGPRDAGVPTRTLVLDAGRCGQVFRAGPDIVVYRGGAFYRAVRITPRRMHQ
ncbi:hypothetical protein V4C53_12400 [Paraburkholderia azotifigens]|uniref:hypothetical protein n=1 Tax=Paraburkholderia azotifigens TaxID=2057004 RepID=UPI00317EEA0C